MTLPRGIDIRNIEHITFFKRDELTSDLICCEISDGKDHHFFHEEMPEWAELTSELEILEGFRKDWFSHVSKPAFAESRFVAFGKVS